MISLSLVGGSSSGSFPGFSCKAVSAIKARRVVPFGGKELCLVLDTRLWLRLVVVVVVGASMGSFRDLQSGYQSVYFINNSQSYVNHISNIKNLFIQGCS